MKELYGRSITKDDSVLQSGKSKPDFNSSEQSLRFKRRERRRGGVQNSNGSHRLSELHFFQSRYMQ